MKSLVILSFLSLNLFAYTIGIYTDEAGGAKARQVINEMRATYPFSILDIEYEIILGNPSNTALISTESMTYLNCRDIERPGGLTLI